MGDNNTEVFEKRNDSFQVRILTYSLLHPNFAVYQSFVQTSISDLGWTVKYHDKMKISFRMQLEQNVLLDFVVLGIYADFC